MTPAATVLGGIEIALEDTVVDYITQWTVNDVFKVKRTVKDTSYSDVEASAWEYGSVTVHAGMVPKNEVGVVLVDQIPVYPFVLFHITKGKDEMPEGCVYTKLVVGMWDNNADYQGYRDSVALLRKLVRSLWYWNTLAETYQINMSEGTEWRVYDSNEVSWPFFLAEATICWRLRTPFMKAEAEELDYQPTPNYIYGLPPAADLPIFTPPIPGVTQR